MNKNTDIFSLIPCEIEQIIFENQYDYIVSIQVGDYGTIAVILNEYDSSALTFVDSGCAENSHINTIHQLLIKFQEQNGFKLIKVIIEAKYGDVIYCRLCWACGDRVVYCVCSAGDALILHSLTESELFIVKNVFDQFEPFDTGDYLHAYHEE